MFLVAGVALAAAPPASNAPKYPSGANAPTTGAGTNAIGSTTTPTVTGIALTSSPQLAFGFYRRNEDVEATVTFSEAVDITGTPQLELDFAGTAKAAACAAATNTTTMACSYRVAGGDSAPNGIAIKANKLTGGTITATGSTTAAVLDHAAVAIDADHKVDAIRPTLVTTGTDAPTTSTDGTTVILTFSEDIRPVNRNLITIQANGATLPTTAADRTGNKAEITLATALTATATNLTVSLASNAVFDVAGNGISFMAATAVTNAVVPPDPADPPDSLKARRGDGEVHLEWVPAAAVPTDPDLAYQLRYGVEGEEYNQWRDIAGSAPGGPNARSYTVTELENGTRYAFEVRVRRRGSGFGTAAEIRQTPEAARWSVSTNRRSVHEGEDVTLGIATSNAVGFYSAPEALTLAVIGQIEFGSTTIEGADPEDYEIRVDGTKARGYTKDITFLNYDDDPDKDPFPAQHFDLEVPVGSTSLDVTVKVLPDGEEEDQEHMSFMVFRGEEWVNGDTWGGTGVNIERSDAGVVKQLSVADAEATEGEDPSLEFVVTLAPAAAWTVRVDYATRDGTALAGSDYTDTSGSLTFAPGDTAKTVSVPVTDDAVQDTPETLTLRLSNAVPPYDTTSVDWGSEEQGVLVVDSVATGTIRNTEDQAEPRTVSVSDASAAEGDAAVFTVSLSAASDGEVPVDYATSDGTATAGSDYTATSGTLAFLAGEVTKTISVPTTEDAEDDGGETFTLTLSNASGAGLGDGEATGTIRNTGTAAELSADFPGSAFTSKRHKGSDDRPQVVVALSEPVADFDKNTPSVAVTGASGLSVQAHTEDGLDNAYLFFMTPDGDGDVTFTLVADAACASGGICTAGGTVLTQVPAALTIPGPDAEASSLSVADAEATEEEDAAMDFVVTLDPAAGDAVTVDYATSDGTATAGEDYTATSGTLTFTAGDTRKTISVPITDDAEDDGGETFTLTLSNASGADLDDATAAGTINDDDDESPPAVSVSDASAAEGDAVAFTVSLSAASSRRVTVEYATSDGTATSGTDYTAESGTLTFAANETSKTVSVATTDDSVDEENETFTLTLSSPANATLGDATATGTIVDNDDELPPLTASICDRTAAVRDEILHLTGASDCSTVTGDELAAITTLELDNAGIDSLKSGDFAGLTELTELELYGNRLGTLPSDVFAGLSSLASLQLSYNNLESLAANVFSGLPSLVNLNVGHNALTSLPASVFSGLSNLKYLFLGANDIAALPAGVLSDLRSLDILFLEGNNFTTLPPGVFSDLASLRWLTLEGGALTTLPEDAFSGLSSLTTADLANNDLPTLPSNVFAGAPDLRELLLSGNNLDGLPDSVFLGLSSLRTLWLQGNNLDPMPVEVSLRTIGGGMVKATVSSGAPFPIEVPLTVTNGTVDGDSVIVIPAGSVESAAITVNPDPGADGAVTADVGTLPGLPVTSDYYSYWGETHPAHHGYELERSAADLPLTVHEIRTPSVASLVLSPASIAEDGGVSTITATVSPAARTAFAVTVSAAAVSPGVAEDFTLSGNTLSVAVGATTSTGTVTITAVNNNVDAADKAVTVSGTIETEDAGVATPENRTLAIEDDDIASTPAVSVSDASAAEGDAVAFTVSLSAASSQQVTVEYATSGGTATSGTDFTAESGTLTFPANETSKTVSVATTDDSVDEENETFTLALSSPANATLGDATATGTIVDNDDELPPLTASFSDMPATHTGAEFTFGLAFSENVELSYVTLRDTAFVVTGGEVRRAQRQQQGSNQAWNITVEPTSANDTVTITLPETTDCDAVDAICTGDERPLSHSLSSVVAGPVIIPAVSVSDASATEGDAVAFTVSLSAATSQQVTVEYATSGGTATSGTDFTAVSGTLTFAANETSQTVSVATTDDSVDEDDETFTLTLSSPTNATLGDAAATGTINDNDESLPSVSVSGASASEGEAVAFTVSLSPASSQQVTVDYATSDGTAAAGSDYTAQSGTLTFAANEISQTVSVATTDDSVDEDDETFTLTLSSPTNATLGDATATGTINDNDESLPSVSVSGASASEGEAVAFTVSLSPASSQQVTVDYATSDGTAAAGSDYTAQSGTLTFAANETSKTVSIATTDDSVDEENETFTLTLSSPTNATLGDATATGTINDDDVSTTPLTASFSNMPASHTGEDFTFGLAFSEEVELSYVTLRDTAFVVTGGEVKTAQRQQQGSNQAWNITVKPTSASDTVTITLPETTDCRAVDAICTKDERPRPLSHSLSATVVDAASSTAGDAANGVVADNPLALLDGLTTDEATEALFGERRLSEARLDALDRLGNRNGRYDLGDLLSWIERCRRGEARCGTNPTDSGPASSATLFGAAAAGRRRISKRPRRRDSGRRGRPPMRGMRRRARMAGYALAMLFAATMAGSCTDDFVGPPDAEQGPGFLTVEWTGPAAARDIGVLIELEGPGIETVRAPGLDLYESSEPGRHQVVVAGSLRAGPLVQFRVPDRGQLPLYRVRVVQVTGEDYALRDPGEYRAVITLH